MLGKFKLPPLAYIVIPDFRHTLYWNPSIGSNSRTIEFYTSDLTGTYQAILRGFTEKGAIWEEKIDFVVE